MRELTVCTTMRLDEFYSQMRNAGPDVHSFELQLAYADPTPDDDIDVQLSEIGWLEVDHEAGQIRLYPRSAVTDETPCEPVPTLGVLLDMLPIEIEETSGLEVVVEFPLDRESKGLMRTSLSAVFALHLGKQSEEAWLLLNPAQAFGNGVLPP